MTFSSNSPFYLQLARIMRERITDGVYMPGARLPDEEALSAEFGVSKDVVRVSLRMLAEEGLLLRIRSKGTFVADTPSLAGPRQILFTTCQNPLAVDRLSRGIEQGIGERNCEIVMRRVHPFDLELERKVLLQPGAAAFSLVVATPAVALDDSDNRRLFSSISRKGIPIITVDHQFTDIQVDALFFDEYGSVKQMAEEVVADVGDDRIAFCISAGRHRIVRERNRALLEIAMRSGNRITIIELPELIPEAEARGGEFARKILDAGCGFDRLVFTGNSVAWNAYRILRNHGQAGRIKIIGSVGDMGVGDEEFNSRLICYYRLYDDFILPLSEMVSLRLDRRIPSDMSMVRLIKFRSMSSSEIRRYFESSFNSGF